MLERIRIHAYPFIAAGLGLVLIFAGFLKVYDHSAYVSWSKALPTAFEIAFGVWLLVGIAPRTTRWVAIACFVGLLNVVLARAANGSPSCGCFGSVPVRPWWAVAFDALAVFSLLLCAPSFVAERVRWRSLRWLFFASSAVAVLLVLHRPLLRPLQGLVANRNSNLEAQIDTNVLGELRTRWTQNRAGLNFIRFETETVTRNIPTLMQFVHRDGRSIQQLSAERTTRTAARYLYRNDQLRCEDLSKEDEDSGQVLVVKTGAYVKYSPRLKQAWISQGNVDAGQTDPIDLRCAGLMPPVSDLTSWLDTCDIRSAQTTVDGRGRKVTRLLVDWRSPASFLYAVTLDFDPEVGFLPVGVTYRYGRDGTIASISDLDYRQVEEGGSWFLRRYGTRFYIAGTAANPEDASPNLTCETSIRAFTQLSGSMPGDLFDPLLPPKTKLVGDLMAAGVTPNESVRASQMTRRIPLTPTRPPTTAKSASQQPSTWSYAVAVDTLLLGSCFLFRKRISV